MEGGDIRLQDQIFMHPEKVDIHIQMAGTREGAMSILIGVAARNSIESGKPARIGSLTDLQPRAKRINLLSCMLGKVIGMLIWNFSFLSFFESYGTAKRYQSNPNRI